MIIVQLFGGLGNQLFQYATARRLAHVHNTSLKVDMQFYTTQSFRKPGLSAFNVQAETATWRDVYRLCKREGVHRALRSCLPWKVGAAASRLLLLLGFASPYRYRTDQYDPRQPLPPLVDRGVVSERFFHFDPELLNCRDDVCLCGFWQSEKYFADIARILNTDLTPKAGLDCDDGRVAQQIQKSLSVSLHIRRRDKASNPTHPGTTLEYCHQAMALARQRLAKPRFFVFSDDWPWVRQYLPSSADVIHVSHNDETSAAADLRLMGLCNHHIVAPSTFSWWAAWLNPNPKKLVISPPGRQWVQLPNYDTSDALPKDWIVVD